MKKRLLGLLGILVILLSVTGCFLFPPQAEVVISNDYTILNGYTVTKISLYDPDGYADVSDYEPKTESGIFTFDGLIGGKGATTSVFASSTGRYKLVCEYEANGGGVDGSVSLYFNINNPEEVIYISFCPDTANNDVPKLVLK